MSRDAEGCDSLRSLPACEKLPVRARRTKSFSARSRSFMPAVKARNCGACDPATHAVKRGRTREFVRRENAAAGRVSPDPLTYREDHLRPYGIMSGARRVY